MSLSNYVYLIGRNDLGKNDGWENMIMEEMIWEQMIVPKNGFREMRSEFQNFGKMNGNPTVFHFARIQLARVFVGN